MRRAWESPTRNKGDHQVEASRGCCLGSLEGLPSVPHKHFSRSNVLIPMYSRFQVGRAQFPPYHDWSRVERSRRVHRADADVQDAEVLVEERSSDRERVSSRLAILQSVPTLHSRDRVCARAFWISRVWSIPGNRYLRRFTAGGQCATGCEKFLNYDHLNNRRSKKIEDRVLKC